MARKEAQRAMGGEAKQKGAAIAGLNFKEGVQSIASSAEVGDYYQYVIDQKISLARQKSAMLPILNQTIDGNKVCIFNEAVHAKYPAARHSPEKHLRQAADAGADHRLRRRLLRRRHAHARPAAQRGTPAELRPRPGHRGENGHQNPPRAGHDLQHRRQQPDRRLHACGRPRPTPSRTAAPTTARVIIEHPIRSDWKLVDPKKPSERSRDVYRFQIEVKAGETAKQEVVEEQSRTDPIALSHDQDSRPIYAIAAGIEIKPEVKNSGAKLLGSQHQQGRSGRRPSRNANPRPTSSKMSRDRDHNFTVDHVIRKEWKRLSTDKTGKDQEGPAVYRFKVEVKSKNTAHQEVVEERVYQDRHNVVAKFGDSTLREFIANPAPAAKVKAALLCKCSTSKPHENGHAGARRHEGDAEASWHDDQARVRDNLKIIPQTSEPYKDFLKKFVAQETQIEEASARFEPRKPRCKSCERSMRRL